MLRDVQSRKYLRVDFGAAPHSRTSVGPDTMALDKIWIVWVLDNQPASGARQNAARDV
jgi:hypothetical protein